MKLLKEVLEPIVWTTSDSSISSKEEKRDYNLAKEKGKVVKMPPLDFIRKTVENDAEYKSLLNQLEKDTMNSYVRGQQYTFTYPYVKENDPTFHDGRHRAYIAYKNKEEVIPVILLKEELLKEKFTEEEKDRIIKDFISRTPCVEVKVDSQGRWLLPKEELDDWEWDD